jgi:uncharacterized membrane protein
MGAHEEGSYQGTGRHSDEDRANGRLAAGLGWFSLGLGATQLLAPGAVARLVGLEDKPAWRWLVRSCGLREITAGLGILFRPDPVNALRARMIGDGVDLAALGVAVGSGQADRTRATMAAGVVLGVAALDTYCSRALQAGSNGRIRMRKSIIINRAPDEVFRLWRQIERLPEMVVDYDLSVQQQGEGFSQWQVRMPGGRTVTWDAEFRADPQTREIVWHSNGDSRIQNAGRVRFEPATGRRGTLVTVDFEYLPPAGRLGADLAKIFGAEPGQMIEAALRRIKQVLETGAVVRSDADIHAGMHPARPPRRGHFKHIAVH